MARPDEPSSTRSVWEERYRAQPAVWSGSPTPSSSPRRPTSRRGGRWTSAAARAPTRSGWPSAAGRSPPSTSRPTALRKAADHAAAAGVADRIEWRHADLTAWSRPRKPRTTWCPRSSCTCRRRAERLFVRLAAAVAPGGTLLVVGHHPSDLQTAAHRAAAPERFFSADDVAAKLDPAKWLIEVVEARPRLSKHHEGDNITVHDAVLRAQRRAVSEAPTRDRSPRSDSTLNVATQSQKSA